MTPANVDVVVKATIAHHNYLKSTDMTNPPTTRYVPASFVDSMSHDGTMQPGGWRSFVENENGMREMGRLSTNTCSRSAMEVLENFMNFFTSPTGSVP